MDIIERFKKYISVDTKSNEENATCPSTLGQLELGKILVEELKELGIKDAFQDKNGYVYGTLEKNIDKDVPTVGFIAHMDTAPDLDGKCINPQIFTYKGGDIKLNEEYTMKVSDFPILNDLIGMELITTDGTTLLGADDKAGVSEIMDAIQYLVNHPEIKHGDIKIGFTPDEEIGRGADLFDVKGFGADFAYTMDGGPIGELEYENFNAATAIVKIQGKNVHPGSSKNTMINSVKIGMEFESMLPVAQKPEYTENYEGFIHLVDFSGTVEFTEMVYIIRDHDMDKFTNKKEILKAAAQYLNTKYIDAIKLEITDSYFNMKEKIMSKMHIVELAKKSMEDIGIVPNIVPIRGGTDGAKLSFMGLPTPNIFAGGMNFHGRYEFIPIEWMRKASELIVKIAENNAK
ncbi:peptidase T [Helcococcus ovis]|uniref:Peptidase T n=1 Tax=Helcococcus ovis TaxID=72026 RepID=A0A4R9C1Q0_9FIRM|nr:peptidase T [Helcococcus ovis]TFF63921.1 peptidase T [Helcococcus ovis]TFF65402.1 peptidase T [Helcococcus ovis]